MIFIIKDNKRMSDCLQFLSNIPQDKPWEVSIDEYAPSRSKSQNRLYWMWLGILAKFMGEKSKDDLHETFAFKFLDKVEKEVKYRDETGAIQTVNICRAKSTTELTTKEFTTYLEEVELAIITAFPDFRLPYPDDYRYAMGGEK